MNTRDRDAILKNTRHKYGVGGCEKLNTVSNGVLAGRDGFAISFRERERESSFGLETQSTLLFFGPR